MKNWYGLRVNVVTNVVICVFQKIVFACAFPSLDLAHPISTHCLDRPLCGRKVIPQNPKH